MANLAIITPRTHPNLGYLCRYLEEHGHKVFLFVEIITPDFELHDGSLTQVIASNQLPAKELEKIVEKIEIGVVRSYSGFPGHIFRSIKRFGKSALVEYSQSPCLVPVLPRFRDFLKALYRVARGRPLRSVTCVLGKNRKQPALWFTTYFPHPGPKVREIPPGSLAVGNVTRIVSIAKNDVPRKRVDLLLEALIRLGFQGELVLVGMDMAHSSADSNTKITRQERRYAQRLSTLVREASMNFRIEQRRNLPHSKALELIRQADIFALPSVKEPFAISPLEAMSLGKTVVISSDNGAVDYVRNDFSGFIFTKDRIEQLVSCLGGTFEPDVRRRIGQEASRVVTAMNVDKRLAVYLRGLVEEKANV